MCPKVSSTSSVGVKYNLLSFINDMPQTGRESSDIVGDGYGDAPLGCSTRRIRADRKDVCRDITSAAAKIADVEEGG